MQKTSIRFKSQLSGIASLSEHYQGSTIGVRRVCTYAYFYWCTHKFGHSYVDTYAHFFRMIFSSFQNFSGSYNFILLKTYCLICLSLGKIDSLLLAFVLKKPYFPTFHTNYLLQSTCQFRLSVKK